MPTLFRVSRIRRTESCEVYARDLLTTGERNARLEHLLRSGWTQQQALDELSARYPERKLNVTESCSLKLCEQYVFQHVDPGDIVVILDRVFVCGPETRA